MFDGQQIADPLIRRFFAYWQSKRGDERFPARRALDPIDFSYVLGDVTLVEICGESKTYRYRVTGSNLVARDGYETTGKTLEDIPDVEYRERIRTTFDAVATTGEPVHGLRDLLIDGRLRCYEVLVLPLASNGCDIDMLIAVQRYLS